MIKKAFLVGILFLGTSVLLCSEELQNNYANHDDSPLLENLPVLPHNEEPEVLIQQSNSPVASPRGEEPAEPDQRVRRGGSEIPSVQRRLMLSEPSSPQEELTIRGRLITNDEEGAIERINRLADLAERRYGADAQTAYIQFLKAVDGREKSIWHCAPGGLREARNRYEESLKKEFGKKFLRCAKRKFEQAKELNHLSRPEISDDESGAEDGLERFCRKRKEPCRVIIYFESISSNNNNERFLDPLPEYVAGDEDVALAELFGED